MEPIERCHLCQRNLEVQGRRDFQTDRFLFSCRVCGNYAITFEASFNNPIPPALRSATRQAYEAGRPLLISNENWDVLVGQHENTAVPENAERLLLHIAKRCPRPGQAEAFDLALDYPVIDCRDHAEFQFFVHVLEKRNLINLDNSKWRVTMAGWEYLLGPIGPGFQEGRCFVAMSFSTEHSAIYEEGVRPAIVDAGYTPACLKGLATNEDINFRILTEIRRAEFTVADFTGQKGGVYFEAGFALALRREVFWTCSEQEKAKVHFDTNHFQYIFWADYADLRARLAEKITAIKGKRYVR